MIIRGTRGLLANPKAGLMFKFQFNPTSLKIDKRPNYILRTPAGWDRPVIWYQNNGERIIEFDVVGDSTRGSDNVSGFVLPKPFGVRDMIATLESFMLPETPLSSMPNFKLRQFVPPPDCYFIYGLRWAKTKVLEAPVKEMLYDPYSLTPNRFFSSLKLLVVEEGSLYEYESAQRVLMARYAGIT
jgi:hypothetical protein